MNEKNVNEFKQMSIYEKLSCIQNKMKAPKNLWNKFGKYWYRNAESILEASKPLCNEYRTTCIVVDAIKYIEGRFYVESIATLYDWDSDKKIEAKASAREEDVKKGMDGSQITGASSSYARKYALNGLFNLDDNKDADCDENHIESKAKEESQKKQQQKQQASKEDESQLAVEITNLKTELQSLGVDLHNDKINAWICKNCFVDNQEIDLNDVEKLKRLKKGYEVLKNGKKK